MANFQTIISRRPAFKEFELQRRMIHRGDVLFFPANNRSETFSTDKRGFRHTAFGGANLAVSDILRQPRYGIVLGASKVFGLGLEGNQTTIPSLLSERFGFPFANVGLPQGNSRNLSSLLFAFLSRAPKAPAAVVHFTTGDLAGFAYSSMADPVFGSPNLRQVRVIAKERGSLPPAKQSIEPLLSFSALWTRSIAQLCRMHKVPLVLAHDSSFFEKLKPTRRDVEFELGKPSHPMEERWFANHKEFADRFYESREATAARLEIPLAGPGRSNNLTFLDELHYDEAGTRAITDDIARALEPLI
jgi:hypothetical protein